MIRHPVWNDGGKLLQKSAQSRTVQRIHSQRKYALRIFQNGNLYIIEDTIADLLQWCGKRQRHQPRTAVQCIIADGSYPVVLWSISAKTRYVNRMLQRDICTVRNKNSSPMNRLLITCHTFAAIWNADPYLYPLNNKKRAPPIKGTPAYECIP